MPVHKASPFQGHQESKTNFSMRGFLSISNIELCHCGYIYMMGEGGHTPASSYKSRSLIFVVFLAFRGFKMAGLHLNLLLASAETGCSNREGPTSIIL